MRSVRAALSIVALAGCAQLAGLDPTSRAADAGGDDDAPAAEAGVDAKVCAGGDARVTDPQTGSCFVLFSTPQPREEARLACAGLGAQLAKVESAAENSTVATLIGTLDAFLGATDAAVENTFLWQDGAPVVLTNWNTGEPNNALNMFEEDCVVMIGMLAGVWDDRPCAPSALAPAAGSYAFVCEY